MDREKGADMVLEVLLVGVFVLGALAVLAGLAYGVARRLRDHRTAEERWADEHGADDDGSLTPNGPQTLWFGTGM
jgi:hypothetical protein